LPPMVRPLRSGCRLSRHVANGWTVRSSGRDGAMSLGSSRPPEREGGRSGREERIARRARRDPFRIAVAVS
jgi:hypothetical protein